MIDRVCEKKEKVKSELMKESERENKRDKMERH